MPERSPKADDLAQKVQVACDFYTNEEHRLHLVWYYDELMSRLTVTDLKTVDLAALVAVLVEAHARKLAAANGPEAPGGVFIPVVRSTVPQRGLKAVS